MDPGDHRARGFGLTWGADVALDGFDPADDGATADVRVRRVAAFAERRVVRSINRGQVFADGFRFAWEDEVAFDMIDGDQIGYLPGPAWRGALPAAFYGSVAALTLAWRGAIPFHACVVEVEGRGIMIAGVSGAGKSSLTAALMGFGARLVADDLAVVRVDRGGVAVVRGRPTMRQHRDTAAWIDADWRAPIADDPRNKWLVRPSARTGHDWLPLGGMLVLGDPGAVLDAGTKIAALGGQLFRPRWLAALPNHKARRRDLLAIAGAVPVRAFPAIAAFEARDQGARAEAALNTIAAMTGK